jgi:hypothetical protein
LWKVSAQRHSALVVILLAFFNSIYAQINITATAQPILMSSHLNGVARNHVAGDMQDTNPATNDTWKEQQFNTKIRDMYAGIDRNFATIPGTNTSGGRNVYRLGHNISDGNSNFDIDGNDVPYPGWHWATEYGTGFGAEAWEADDQGNLYSKGVMPSSPSHSFEIGAGIHRFMYTHTVPNTGGRRIFSGFTITHNYPNSISVTECPESRTIELSNDQANYTFTNGNTDWWDVGATPLSDIDITHVGGPRVGQTVPIGAYEIDFRIANRTNGDVAYCGFVVSINNYTELKIVRTTTDIRGIIDPNPILYNPGATAMERHNAPVGYDHFRLSTNASTFDANLIYTSTQYDGLELACAFRPFGYDHIRFFTDELQLAEADAAIVLNIGTGYPEEAVGLVEHMGGQLAYVELGSELMGEIGNVAWSKGGDVFGLTPRLLGEATLPFARAIKTVFPKTRVATTSTYNFSLDWRYTPSPQGNPMGGTPFTIQERISDWINALSDGTQCYVDFVNIHTYPTNAISSSTTTSNKVTDLFSVGEVFEESVLPLVTEGLQATQFGGSLGGVITESNTSDRQTAACSAAYLSQKEQATIVEGLYYAEIFIAGARNQVAAFTPFALFKSSVMYGNTQATACAALNQPGNCVIPSFAIVNNDPTNIGSYIFDDPDYNLFFYPNNSGSESCYDEIYVRPTFKAKQLLSENLGREIITASWTGNQRQVTLPGTFFGNTAVAPFGILATRDPSDGTILLLVTNRRIPGEPNPDVQITLNNAPANVTARMTLIGRDIHDKNPIVTGASGTPFEINSTDPIWETLQAPNGLIGVRPLSVNLFRISVSPPPNCVAITAPVPSVNPISQLPTITWISAQNATGYRILIGNTAGASNFLNTFCWERIKLFCPAGITTLRSEYFYYGDSV